MKILFLFLILGITAVHGQEKFRINEKQRRELLKISPELTQNVLIVESLLDSRNNPPISIIRQSFTNYRLTEKSIKKVESILCIECYELEWNNYLLKVSEANERQKLINDSIALAQTEKYRLEAEKKRESEIKQREDYKKYQDSIKNSPTSENPYDVLQRSLYAFDKYNRSLTVFRKMDYNFAGGNIQWYMQNDFKMTFTDDYTLTKNKIVENYIAKVSSKDERIRITYNVKYHTDIIGYYESDEVFIIESVEITGTNNKVVELFLNYWPGKITIEGYKEGVIATKQLLGDYISLIGQGGRYKISITKGSMDVNYQTTFGINAKK